MQKRYAKYMASKIPFDIDKASDSYIEDFSRAFIERNLKAINSLAYNVFKDNDKLSHLAFQEIVHDEMKKACYSFVNNKKDPDYIDAYLFACIHKTIKKINSEDKHNVHICPACKFFSKTEILDSSKKKLVCNACKNALNHTTYKWEENLRKTFSEHSRRGYACIDCDGFIPETSDKRTICPYPNCSFAGDVIALKPIKHPSIKATLEIPTLNESFIDTIASDSHAIVKDDLVSYAHILNECIESQIAVLKYKCNDSTFLNKLCMYNAYKNIIQRYPDEMISYLVLLNRNIKIQHKIFQEFVRILETKIPFSFTKKGVQYTVNSLLDKNLCVFDGISEFDASVDENFEIDNGIKDLYVGGRKGSYCRPFYIGKMLEITDIETGMNLMHSIKEHTFTKIIMNNDVRPYTRVHIKCLKTPPHYQMGAMVHLNRIRRAIVDRIYLSINGRKRITK